MNDAHPYLIALYQALQHGYELPENISREQYHYIKDHKDEDKALSGFVGFGVSFGGKWFDGYAFDRQGRNYALEAKKHTMKIWQGIKNSTFTCLDYKDVYIPENAVIYCDPPYKGTTAYKGMKEIDYQEFWQYMRELSKTHKVFVSEETAPTDFECIWQKEVRRTLDRNKSNQFIRTEKLWIYKGEHDD